MQTDKSLCRPDALDTKDKAVAADDFHPAAGR
jgi:hypothetical protein